MDKLKYLAGLLRTIKYSSKLMFISIFLAISTLFIGTQALLPATIYTLNEVVLIKTFVTYSQARETCCSYGFYLANLTDQNWDDAETLMNTELGVNKLAYIWGWNNDHYVPGTCLSAQTASTFGSLAVNPTSNCNYYLSVLCTVEPPPGEPPICGSSGYTTSTVTTFVSSTSTSTNTVTSTSTSTVVSVSTP